MLVFSMFLGCMCRFSVIYVFMSFVVKVFGVVIVWFRFWCMDSVMFVGIRFC